MVKGTEGEVFQPALALPNGCFYPPTLITGLDPASRAIVATIRRRSAISVPSSMMNAAESVKLFAREVLPVVHEMDAPLHPSALPEEETSEA